MKYSKVHSRYRVQRQIVKIKKTYFFDQSKIHSSIKLVLYKYFIVFVFVRGEARPLSHLAEDLSGLTRVQRAARFKGSSLPVTSFAGGDLSYSPPPPPEVIRATTTTSNRNLLNFNKSFSLGNYYRAEEPKVSKGQHRQCCGSGSDQIVRIRLKKCHRSKNKYNKLNRYDLKNLHLLRYNQKNLNKKHKIVNKTRNLKFNKQKF